MNIADLRQRVNNGEQLLTLFKDQYKVMQPEQDIVNRTVTHDVLEAETKIYDFGNKLTLLIPTAKGWLVLDRILGTPKFKPQIIGVIAEETDLYKRESYILDGMTDHDVLNYLEELQT